MPVNAATSTNENCRAQKPNETLQRFAMEVERLVQFTYPGALVNSIRDPDINFFLLILLVLTILSIFKLYKIITNH